MGPGPWSVGARVGSHCGAGSEGRRRSGGDDVIKGQVQAVHAQCPVSPRLGRLEACVTEVFLETAG